MRSIRRPLGQLARHLAQHGDRQVAFALFSIAVVCVQRTEVIGHNTRPSRTVPATVLAAQRLAGRVAQEAVGASPALILVGRAVDLVPPLVDVKWLTPRQRAGLSGLRDRIAALGRSDMAA